MTQQELIEKTQSMIDTVTYFANTESMFKEHWEDIRRGLEITLTQLKTNSMVSQCTGCGHTENLTECRAIPDGTYHLCRKCLAEERGS